MAAPVDIIKIPYNEAFADYKILWNFADTPQGTKIIEYCVPAVIAVHQTLFLFVFRDSLKFNILFQ
jgi:hypothetical protein